MVMTLVSEPSKSKLEYKDTTYWGLFKIKGISNFINWSFLWALLFTSLVFYLLWREGSIGTNLIIIGKAINEPLLGASAGIFGIVIAALTLTIALFHQSLLPIMLETKLLHKYLFPFWKAVGLWGISILLCFFQIILEEIKFQGVYMASITGIEIFIFLYSTFYTVKLTGLVIQLALQRAQIKEQS
jgi:hypothetical protein